MNRYFLKITQRLLTVFAVSALIVGLIVFAYSIVDVVQQRGWKLGTSGIAAGLFCAGLGLALSVSLLRRNRRDGR